ncbi:hypothetical protein BDB00DRAFT_740213, partial [Zychaea mexicana]|uniref:uncharacterized protein n=1 Tax=Zychaea mexicana TaxID=64656 RepID=UPI0022FEA81D
QNSHVSLLALIDAVYPPLQCTECNVVSHTRQDQQKHFPTHPPRYHCLHPHCELFFRTKSALRFHISRTHLPSIVTGIDSLPTTPTCTSPPTPPQPSPPTSPSSSPIAPLLATTKQPKNQQQQQAQKQRNIMSSWRVSSFGRPPTSSRAPRGSKKIVLSPQVESLLNSVYHPLQCPSCHQHFNRKTNVIKHLTDQHYGEEPYRCVFAECLHPKLYATREGLVYHILRVHDQQ